MNPLIFNVVLDIDNVLADTKIKKQKEEKFYKQKGFVLEAIKTHYIFPGVIEMMQLLFNMPDVKVSFFSSGHQNRNELFVEKLLEHSLGKEHYLQIKENVKILSGKKEGGGTDLFKNTNEKSRIQFEKYGLNTGILKKSLEKIVGNKEDLANCVLIDDDTSWINYGEESNYLHVPELNTTDFVEMEKNSKYYCYDEYQQRKISFKDFTSFQNIECLKNCVMNAEYIGLIFEKEKCTLGYFNLDQKQYEEIEISEESNEDIFRALKKHYQKSESEEDTEQTTLITKDRLDLILYDFIEKKNGKTVAINLSCNRICYVVGLLFKALEFARSGSNLNEFLFPIHFSKKSNNDGFEPYFWKDTALHKREEYYHYGLEQLQKVNPNFTFINPVIYRECCEMEINIEELDLQNLWK